MVEVNWVPRAERDPLEIWKYIAKDSLRYAEETTLRLTGPTKILMDRPRIRKPVPELGLEDFRELVVADYRIIYWIESNILLHIVAIQRQKRELLPIELTRRIRSVKRKTRRP